MKLRRFCLAISAPGNLHFEKIIIKTIGVKFHSEIKIVFSTSINSVIKVSDENLHCVFDVRGDAIRELQKKNIYPIAIYIKPKVSNRIRTNLLDDQIAWLM